MPWVVFQVSSYLNSKHRGKLPASQGNLLVAGLQLCKSPIQAAVFDLSDLHSTIRQPVWSLVITLLCPSPLSLRSWKNYVQPNWNVSWIHFKTICVWLKYRTTTKQCIPRLTFTKTPEKPQILYIEETLEEAALVAFGVKKADAFPNIPRRIFLPF